MPRASDSTPARFDAVIFDLDGTLVDTIDDIADALDHVLTRAGLATPTRPQYLEFIGEGLRRLVERAAPGESDDRVEALITAYRDHYAAHLIVRSKLFDGIATVLDALRDDGITLGVLSNKPDAMTQRIAAELLAAWPMPGIAGERDDLPRKPDPAGALRIAALLGVPPTRCAFVGDTKTDMLTATAAGMTPIGVTWGFRGRDELTAHRAAHVVDSPVELLAVLRGEPRQGG